MSLQRFASIAAAVLLVSSVGAQEQTPVFRGRTDLVQLDVSVLDKRRRPVRGLKAADFQVFEDGKPQELVAASEIDLPDEYAETPVWAKAAGVDVSSNDVGDKRLFAIIVRTSMLVSPGIPGAPGTLSRRPDPGLVDAVTAMVHGIIDRLGPRDMAAILGSVCNQAFTEDRERLRAAIDSIRPGAPPCRPSFGSRSAGAFGRGVPGGDLVESVAAYLSVVPQRRKAIVYISGGYLLGPGRVPHDGMFVNAAWLAQMANVNIYTINPNALGPRGVRTGTSLTDGLKGLAEQTGGLAITDPAKYEAGLDQMFVENGSYYMLGYKTTHPEMDGKFRKLSVKVSGHPDVIVRGRPSWYRPKKPPVDGPVTALTPSMETSRGLYGLLPNLDITFEANAVPFLRAGGMPAVGLVTEITEPIAVGVTRIAQQMDLRALVYDETGAVKSDTTVRAAIDEAPTSDNSIKYVVRTQLDLPPGQYSFRLVAHNARTDKLGSTEFDVRVPDFQRNVISMSGVAISMPERPPLTTFGDLKLWAPITPASQRAFTTSERATASFQVYQGGTGPLAQASVTAHVLDGRGNSVLDVDRALAPAGFRTARSADVSIDLPLDKLHAGAYLLTIEAALGAHRAPRRDVRFTVR